MPDLRTLVTGLRSWIDRTRIVDELDQLVEEAGVTDPASVTLMSGACPSGADRLAEQHALARGWVVERHPARWSEHGRAAGFIRNQQMVDRGADVCVVFCRNGSASASHTGHAAERAGIPTRWNEAL
ncbi:conserved hypothetical protein [Catenulispora acidiphila DSM 44928]|uniref:YspA cpYpsA-related SLOG domain-containing protein n=1 Tax=Catenulispora acidiphila (strain DSM 44928 / JCM 14897 / NBRC 102108 / NRRL B-24433 / ID139908) TaxID=479433 RepID=C7Q318_CATAD|nr:DUF2493 domain-containing protein [Catenulispora acidiphila]ACU71910.1 conserved hypothetical protein [Catenulispora acidiphila DSM 44928]